MTMHLHPLSRHPEYFDRVMKMIELSFGYQNEHSFKNDFLPLTHQSNWDNLFFALSENKEVVASGGFRVLQLGAYRVAFIGGIATDPAARGTGLGRQMMESLLEKVKNYDLVLLWSEKSDFYAQFGFKEFGFLYENHGRNWQADHAVKALSKVTHEEQKHLRKCYESYYQTLLTPTRSRADWEIIFNMQSVNCSLYNWGYIFCSKGMDLGGIIHEAACLPGHEIDLALILKDYHYWLRGPGLESSQTRFAGLIRLQTAKSLPAIDLERLFIPGVDAI